VIKVASVVDEHGLTVLAVNRQPEGEEVQLTGTLREFRAVRSAKHHVLAHPDLKAANSADEPENVSPHAAASAPVLDGGGFSATLPPFSWNVLRFEF
jgi:alpha-N-arabinofuranosidase